MERHTFRAYVPQTLIPRDGLITGLALPYNVQGATPEHPAFPRGILVATDLEKPLFWEHDYSVYIGKVLRVWEAEDGVRFAAQVMTDTPAAKGVSVGGAYVTDGKDIKALYIYEISLTNSPAYKQAKYTIMATEKINAQEPAEYITRAEFEQKMQEILARIEELAAMVQNALAVLSATPPTELEAAVRNARAYSDLVTALSQTQRLLTERMQASEAKQKELAEVLQKLVAALSDYEKKLNETQSALLAAVREEVAKSEDKVGALLEKIIKV